MDCALSRAATRRLGLKEPKPLLLPPSPVSITDHVSKPPRVILRKSAHTNCTRAFFFSKFHSRCSRHPQKTPPAPSPASLSSRVRIRPRLARSFSKLRSTPPCSGMHQKALQELAVTDQDSPPKGLAAAALLRTGRRRWDSQGRHCAASAVAVAAWHRQDLLPP